MERKMNKKNKKIIILLAAAGLLILCGLCFWLFLRNSHQPTVSLNDTAIEMDVTDTYVLTAIKENTRKELVWISEDESVATVTDGVVTAVKAGETKVTVSAGEATASCTVTVTDSQTAPMLVLDHNNVMIGLNHSFEVQASVYWKGKEVEDEIAYTWEPDEGASADFASIESKGRSATITGLAYGDTAFQVSTVYRGTLLVKKLTVSVTNIDVIFDSPNMELSAGCYMVNLGLLETETDTTSIKPEIYVYDKESLVENPVFTWTNSDETIASMDKNGIIRAKKAGTTIIDGIYKESKLRIQVNVHRSRLERDTVYIEARKKYVLSFSELKGMEVEDALFDGVSVMLAYNKGTGTVQFDPDKLPETGVSGELVIQTDKAELTMEAVVVTMALYSEADLNQLAAVITANNGAGYYALANNITCTDVYDSNLTVEFKGTLDGRGNAISNMITSDRDGNNRGLLGASFGSGAVLKNIAFLNAKHSGKGGFIVTNAAGTMENVFVQIDISNISTDTYDNATSVLASTTFGVFATKNVLIEYLNPLPADAATGYAVWQLYYGYGKHQGLYAVGADKVCAAEEDLRGGIADLYGSYPGYADFLAAGNDLSAWENDFWTLNGGIPYPKKLGTREASVPNVKLPEYAGAGSEITIEGFTIYDRVVITSTMREHGITVKNGILTIPATVPSGTSLSITVQSVFDSSKKVTLTTQVLSSDKITLSKISNAEVYHAETFDIDLGEAAATIGDAALMNVTVDGSSFRSAAYQNGTLTLDAGSLGELGRKTVEAVFKRGGHLTIVTIPVDACTLSIETEADLNKMASVIEENGGAGRYVLANDITCTGTYDSGLHAAFKGTFDGHGYTIYNLTTSDRDGNNRGLFGASFDSAAVLKKVSFVNAKHSGKGGFIAASAGGTVEDVYIQIDISNVSTGTYDDATSVLASSTFGGFSTNRVFIEYKKALPEGSDNGYPVWQLYYGYGKHQGLYAVGTEKVGKQKDDLGGGLSDDYAAYRTFEDYVVQGVDLSKWENDYWGVTNGIPYPKHLGTRQWPMPGAAMPETVAPGSRVSITDVTVSERIVLGSDMTALGIALEGNQLLIPDTIAAGTTVKVTVESIFDPSKKIELTAKVEEIVPEPAKLTWADFGVPYGSMYASERWFTYQAASNMENTIFEDDIILSKNSCIMYATSNGWHGLQIGVNSAGKFFAKGNNYNDTTGEAVYDASTFGLTALADQRITLRIEMHEVTETTAKVKVSVNGIPAGEEFTIQKADNPAVGKLGNVLAFGNNSGDKVTVPAKEDKLTKLTWADFGVPYGSMYASERWFTYQAATNMNNTAFEDDITFSRNSGIMYATSNGWHGLQIGVNSEGKFFARGNNYSDTTGGAVYDASTFGLTALADQRITLRIEMREVTDTTASVRVYVNGISAGDGFTIQKVDNPAVGKLGNVLAFGNNSAGAVTVPAKKPNLTSLTWADFGVPYGSSYASERWFTYNAAANMNNTVFEDAIIFSANSCIMYGTSNGWHGLQIGVNSEGKFYAQGNNYHDTTGGAAYDASTFGLTTFEGQRITLRIEMSETTDTTAKVKVYVNGIPAGDAFTIQKADNPAVGKLGNVLAFGNNSGGTVKIPETQSRKLAVKLADYITNAEDRIRLRIRKNQPLDRRV